MAELRDGGNGVARPLGSGGQALSHDITALQPDAWNQPCIPTPVPIKLIMSDNPNRNDNQRNFNTVQWNVSREQKVLVMLSIDGL
ncbi:MAG: hypothetical protein ACK587_17565 [Cyanobacteriota bacterium]|jgi:hypothetical protein